MTISVILERVKFISTKSLQKIITKESFLEISYRFNIPKSVKNLLKTHKLKISE